MKHLIVIASLSLVVAFGLVERRAHADDESGKLFAEFCRDQVADIQEDRRVCVIGIVESESKVKVLFATSDRMVGTTVQIFQSAVQQGAQIPLEDLSALQGHIAAVSGFRESDTIYSARML